MLADRHRAAAAATGRQPRDQAVLQAAELARLRARQAVFAEAAVHDDVVVALAALLRAEVGEVLRRRERLALRLAPPGGTAGKHDGQRRRDATTRTVCVKLSSRPFIIIIIIIIIIIQRTKRLFTAGCRRKINLYLKSNKIVNITLAIEYAWSRLGTAISW